MLTSLAIRACAALDRVRITRRRGQRDVTIAVAVVCHLQRTLAPRVVAPTEAAVGALAEAVSGIVGEEVGEPRIAFGDEPGGAVPVPAADEVAPVAAAGEPGVPSEGEIGARGASADKVSVGDMAPAGGEPGAPALPGPVAVMVEDELLPGMGVVLPGVAEAPELLLALAPCVFGLSHAATARASAATAATGNTRVIDYFPVLVVLLEVEPEVPLVPLAGEASVPPAVPEVPDIPLLLPEVPPMLEPDEPLLPAVPEPDIEPLPDALLPLGVDDELLLGEELVSVDAVVVGDEPVVPVAGVLAVDELLPLPLLPVLVPVLPQPARPAVASAMAATRGRIFFMVAP